MHIRYFEFHSDMVPVMGFLFDTLVLDLRYY